MPPYCEDHIKMVQTLAEVNATTKAVNQNVQAMTVRLNGAFKAIGDHVADGPVYRSYIATNKTKIEEINRRMERAEKEKDNKQKLSYAKVAIITSLIVAIVTSVVQVAIVAIGK